MEVYLRKYGGILGESWKYTWGVSEVYLGLGESSKYTWGVIEVHLGFMEVYLGFMELYLGFMELYLGNHGRYKPENITKLGCLIQ